ncbi:hypothetical protein SCHPADRAFT_622744 [Schizopora paradoxa]|uniref:Uncharacterized protein n=1 Tax=Schizopora paradoxa TaxID=27342 RepID=A0A0H2R8A2_9AGAM|nr:hypothetical protein SCHPADRAFT_622744 [Schizopora paradoxa]
MRVVAPSRSQALPPSPISPSSRLTHPLPCFPSSLHRPVHPSHLLIRLLAGFTDTRPSSLMPFTGYIPDVGLFIMSVLFPLPSIGVLLGRNLKFRSLSCIRYIFLLAVVFFVLLLFTYHVARITYPLPSPPQLSHISFFRRSNILLYVTSLRHLTFTLLHPISLAVSVSPSSTWSVVSFCLLCLEVITGWFNDHEWVADPSPSGCRAPMRMQ